MTEYIICPECGTQRPKGAVNHIYCSRSCAKKEQSRRRTLRDRGITVGTVQAVAQSAVRLTPEAQRNLEYWQGQARAAEMNGMTLDEWIQAGRLNNPYSQYTTNEKLLAETTTEEIEQKRAADMGLTIEQYRKWLAEHTETANDAITEIYGAARRKGNIETKLIEHKPALPTEEKKDEK